MISIRQIRAARGLLGISQAELAKNAGLSSTAMNNIERGNAKARADTLVSIQEYFEGEGVEFTEGDGVRYIENVFNAKFFEGPEGAILFLKDIIKTLKRLPPAEREVLWYGNNNTAYMRRHGALYHYYKQLIEIGGRERIIIGAKTRDFYAPASTSQYAVLNQKDLDQGYLAGVYGGRRHFTTNHSKILLMESKFMYDQLYAQGQETWKRSKKIHLFKRLFDQDDLKQGKQKAA